MKATNLNFDVIINGAGYIGLITAFILAKNGLNVVLIDKRKLDINRKEKTSDKNDPSRLFAIAAASSKFLLDNHICLNMKNLAQPIEGIYVTDYNSNATLEFDPDEIGLDCLGYMFDEKDLMQDLLNSSFKEKKVTIIDNTEISNVEYSPYHINLVLKDNKNLQAKLLLAADGKNSFVRKLLKIKTKKIDYTQDAIICDIKHEFSHRGIAIENFYPGGPFAILPKKDRYCSSIVWSTTNDTFNMLNKLSEEELNFIIAQKINAHLGRVKVTSKIKSYPLSLVVSKDFIKRRVALIGDALHAIHPIAGQGFNLGLRDIMVITDLINKQKNLGLDIGSDLMLENYQKRRARDVDLMITATHEINGIFASTFVPTKLFRRIGMRIINKSSFLKKAIMKYAAGY